MRQIILDTETTGLDPGQGHRIIEIGCIELVSRRLTGRHFHRYLNPERDIDEGAVAVHGLTRERLAREPRFADVVAELFEFIDGAELVIHNAPFDVGFLDAELGRLAKAGTAAARRIADRCRVLDTLALAREMHPGQRNSLDALCKRYNVDNSKRDLHGALLDARILAEVYLAMTGGQSALALGEARGGSPAAGAPTVEAVGGDAQDGTAARQERDAARRSGRDGGPAGPLRERPAVLRDLRLPVYEPTPEELAAHEALLARIAKASGGKCLFE